LKLWLLDADIVIDFLALDIFDKLVEKHKIYLASTVINEIKYYIRAKKKIEINFREKYVDSGLVAEASATTEEVRETYTLIPKEYHQTIHAGEVESITILVKKEDLLFCGCDAASIRILPFVDLSDRALSAEKLLERCGLSNPNKLLERHTEKYFEDNLSIGKQNKIYHFQS
jgi:predicted nucleic-acid-binding protein